MNFNKLKFALKIATLSIFSLQMLWAYPGFGKKINPELTESCSQCHVAFPKLRLYGRTTREIGYNVPVTKSDDESWIKSIYRAIPIGFRGKLDLADSNNGKSMLSLVQILSSGTMLNNKVTWWYHKHLYDTEGDLDSKTIDADKFVPFNEGQPHEFWFQYNYSTAVNLRFGMFELPFWFSPVKTRVGESDYLYYGASGNPDMTGTLAGPQFGFALNGYLGKGSSEDDWGAETEDNYAEGYNYAFAMTNGKGVFPNGFDFLADADGPDMAINTFYGRFTKKEAAYAAGLWALTGKVEVTAAGHDMDAETEMYYRLGSDLDLFLRGDDINLYGSFVYGKDVNRDFVGGLVGYEHLLRPKILGQVRWDGVFFISGEITPEEDDDGHGGHKVYTQENKTGSSASVRAKTGDAFNQTSEDAGGHAHGAMIMDDASSISAGIFYLPLSNVRIGLEYVYQLNGDIGKDINGRGGMGIFQIQFGF